jgi:hypothetical protein
MNPKAPKFVLGAWILVLSSPLSFPLRAQVADAALDGTVTDASSKVVPNAKISIKNADSGDSNRDLHMLQVTRGGQFPMVTLRTHLPESASGSATIHADLEIQFAGQTATYNQVLFQQKTQGDEIRISGTIPATLTDFKIDPPSLLTVPVKNEMPVRVEMTWQRQK